MGGYSGRGAPSLKPKVELYPKYKQNMYVHKLRFSRSNCFRVRHRPLPCEFLSLYVLVRSRGDPIVTIIVIWGYMCRSSQRVLLKGMPLPLSVFSSCYRILGRVSPISIYLLRIQIPRFCTSNDDQPIPKLKRPKYVLLQPGVKSDT